MIKKNMVKNIVVGLMIAVLGAFSAFGAGVAFGSAPVFAENAFNQQACGQASGDERAALGCDTGKTAPQVATEIFQIIISLIGIVAVLMIVVAGQRYITSNGEPEKIKQARNMIIYSLIGLIVALLAFAVVTFVQHSIS